MRRLNFLLPFALGVPALAAGLAEPIRPVLAETSRSYTAPIFLPPTSPALTSLPSISVAPPLAGAFAGTGPAAPALPELDGMTRALFSRYLPSLYRPLPVRYEYGESKLGGGGGHNYDPETGHQIVIMPGKADERGDVKSAIGERHKIRVQAKIEQIITSVHEFAHAVFDDATGAKVADRPDATAFDAMTEGFAVKVEQLVLAGMLRDERELGLSARDAADIRAVLAARRRWLAEEDTHYAEGTPVWDKAHDVGGEKAMAELLSSLKAKRLMEVRRADAVYQLSLAGPETARAHLGEGGPAPLRAGFDAAARAAAGRAVTPAEAASASAAIDAAGPEGWDWLIRRALSRESDFGEPDQPMWIVPVFLRRGEDLAAALFRLAALNRGLAGRTAAHLAGMAARPDGAARVFEERGPTARLSVVVSGAEKLPWTAAAKRRWDAAVRRWTTKVE
jgi:hypothetical protein